MGPNLSICILFVLVCYSFSHTEQLDAPHKFLTLYRSEMVCSGSMPCGYSFCPWKRTFRIRTDACMFVETSCSCPRNSMCTMTNDMTPGSSIVTLNAYCLKSKIKLHSSNIGLNTFINRYGTSYFYVPRKR